MGRAWTDLPPREKLLKYGQSVLSDAELLAIFLRTGTRNKHVMELAEDLLTEFGSIRAILLAEYSAFREVGGIGEATFAQLHAIAELAERFYDNKGLQEENLSNPRTAKRFLQGRLMRQEREIFLVIFMNNQHQVIIAEEMFAGTFNCVEVHPRDIIRRALQLNAAALIVAHNHPSGVSEPSRADRVLTTKLKEAYILLSIRLLDHLIIGHGETVSFAERGWL